MIRRRRAVGAARATFLFIGLTLIATAAMAQPAEPSNKALDRWVPALDANGLAGVHVAPLPLDFAFDLWLSAGYVGNLLVVNDPNANIKGSLLGPRFGFHLGGSVTPLPFLQVGLNLPLILGQGRGPPPSRAFGVVDPLEPVGLGDLSFFVKAWFLEAERAGIDLSALFSLSLPSHVPRQAYLGDDVVTFAGMLIASRQFGDLTLAGNLGYHWRDPVNFLDVTIGPEFRLGVGAGYDLEPLTELPLQATAAWNLAVRHDALFERPNESPSEFLFEMKYFEWAPVVLSGSFGFGFVAGVGTPDVRVMVTVRYANQPDDRDGDRIPDEKDECPDDPEDRDGFEDANGCPDPDNDKDEIPDEEDQCPNEPETENNYLDEDGCPDKGALFDKDGFFLNGNVHFEVGKAILKTKSKKLLDEAAALLNDHPEVTKIRIEGHTDNDGDDAFNMDLSQRRANAVRTYLISKGVEGERLRAIGYGETRPVASNATARGRFQNRRVDFVIEEQNGKKVETAK